MLDDSVGGIAETSLGLQMNFIFSRESYSQIVEPLIFHS